MENNTCINCNNELAGNYCSSCGQKKGVDRITFKTLFQEYIGRFLGLDTKFIRTTKDLTINPGIVSRTFIEGNRVRYISPISYFFIFTTLSLLSYSIVGVDINEFFLNTSEGFQTISNDSETRQQVLFQEKFLSVFSQNM
jgi:hypothetical protein